LKRKTLAVLPACLVLGLSCIFAGCGNEKSPDVSPEQLKGRGAGKSTDFQDMMSKTKAKNSGAPGGPGVGK